MDIAFSQSLIEMIGEMNPNRVDLDTSTVNVPFVSPAQTSVIIQDQIEWSQEFRIESKQDQKLIGCLVLFIQIVK